MLRFFPSASFTFCGTFSPEEKASIVQAKNVPKITFNDFIAILFKIINTVNVPPNSKDYFKRI